MSLEIPCHVMDSSKPIWQEVRNCGMIISTNVLVAFDFRILHANGIKVIPDSLSQQLAESGTLSELAKLPKLYLKS